MALTAAEKERCRYHLGYPQVQPAPSIQFGLPRPIQTAFMVETSMQNLIAETEPRVRDILSTLDTIECRLKESQGRMSVVKIETTELRQNEAQALEDEYRRWAGRLADILGVPLYAYSNRFWAGGNRGGAGNIPVSG